MQILVILKGLVPDLIRIPIEDPGENMNADSDPAGTKMYADQGKSGFT